MSKEMKKPAGMPAGMPPKRRLNVRALGRVIKLLHESYPRLMVVVILCILGSAAVSAYYAGDFLAMYEENDDLAFFYPKEGTNTKPAIERAIISITPAKIAIFAEC